MCGIAGLIYRDNWEAGDQEIRSMTNKVAHRGPDGFGYWQKENVFFGHRRLAIQDLSPAGDQPMHYGGYVITYNGEIYNFPEIKATLEKLGYVFRSHGDTEVILAAYQHWGFDCQQKFNGMWAFAIYDPLKNLVFCSRDRFGVKPFYYLHQQGRFAFGSEIKQLLPFLDGVSANKRALAHYLLLGQVNFSNETFFEELTSLPGSHYFIYNLQNHHLSVHRYYEVSVHSEYKAIDYEEARRLFVEHFQRSVQWRLRSDVPVGTCLSGGLDSSFVALHASKNYKSERLFSAFTASSIDEKWDEVNYARIVSEKLNLDWLVTRPGTKDFVNALENVCTLQEEPFVSPSIFMQYFTMQLAQQRGMKVLLDGQGADETLLGYDRYLFVISRGFNVARRLAFLREAKKRYRLRLKTLLRIGYYQYNFGLRKKVASGQFKGMRMDLPGHLDERYLEELSTASRDTLQFQKMEITSSHLPALLRYEDRNSMHCSIETRLPYLDWQLLELSLSLPVEFKVKDGWSKYLIRDSMKGELPESIAWRQGKFAFNSPDDLWLANRGYFENIIRESAMLQQLFTDPVAIARTGTAKLWKLVNLACWEKAYDVVLRS